MNSNCILRQTTGPYSPQQNGADKRKNRHILEVTKSLLIDGNAPSHLLGEAVSSLVYLINWTPSTVLNFRRPLDMLPDHCILPSMVYLPPYVFWMCYICSLTLASTYKARGTSYQMCFCQVWINSKRLLCLPSTIKDILYLYGCDI